MQPLIDGDILAYELAFVGQGKTEDGIPYVRNIEWLIEVSTARIADICEAVGATKPPIIFFTNDERLHRMVRRIDKDFPEYEPNFRIAVAKEREYKGGRKSEKPVHFHAIRAWLFNTYDCRIANGFEADDHMCIEQYTKWKELGEEAIKEKVDGTTIICSRDKDLRQCPGWHYGWEVGKQGEFGPHYFSNLGEIELGTTKTKKIVGGGFKFFCAQLFTGDPVDTIAGLHGYGPVRVIRLLQDARTERECLDIVQTEYRNSCGDNWKEQLREQSDLLWMVKTVNPDGSLRFFNRKDWV